MRKLSQRRFGHCEMNTMQGTTAKGKNVLERAHLFFFVLLLKKRFVVIVAKMPRGNLALVLLPPGHFSQRSCFFITRKITILSLHFHGSLVVINVFTVYLMK